MFIELYTLLFTSHTIYNIVIELLSVFLEMNLKDDNYSLSHRTEYRLMNHNFFLTLIINFCHEFLLQYYDSPHYLPNYY